MLEVSESIINQFVVHKVGNKASEEGFVTSSEISTPDEELDHLLKKYFFKSFLSLQKTNRFGPESDINSNKIFSLVAQIFDQPDQLLKISKEILEFLYNQSTHPHIKNGELCVVHFDNIVLEGEMVEAIGIFKSELKDTFLKIKESANSITYLKEEGININKLDKGCLVFNTEKELGYRVMMVDSNNYDAQYWKDDFLGLVPETNEEFQTKSTLDLVQQFASEFIAQEEDQKEQISMLNRSMQYFQEEENFDVNDFAEKVIQTPAYIEAFKEYKPIYEEERGIEMDDSFEIEQTSVETTTKKFNNTIKLDTNVQIKLNFNDAESLDKYVEKGYDEVKGMHYYVVYFNNETT